MIHRNQTECCYNIYYIFHNLFYRHFMILPSRTRFHDPELNSEYDIFYKFCNYFIISCIG